MQITEIQDALAPCCQHGLTYDASAIILDAIDNAEGISNIPLPPVFFSGYAGLGKTHALDVIADLLKPYNFDVIRIPVECKPSVFCKILIDSIESKQPCIIFCDEMHSLPAATRNYLKMIAETQGKVKEISLPLGREEFKVTINPALHWIIGASNEAVKDSALIGSSGRFRTIQFLPYNDAGKQVIFRLLCPQYAPGMEFTEEMEAFALDNVRPFARSIKSMIQALRTQVRLGNDVSDVAGVKQALIQSGYIKGGWSQNHLKILLFIDKGPRQVQEICAGPLQGADQATAQAYLSELMQATLVRTDNGKKVITAEGQAFLKSFVKKKK